MPLRIEDLSFRQRLQPCLDELIASGREQVVTYIERDHYLQLRLELIGGTQGRYLCRACVYHIPIPAKTGKPTASTIAAQYPQAL